MIIDLRSSDCTFGKTGPVKEEEEENKQSEDITPTEESLKRFDKFLKDSIEALEKSIGELEE